MLPVCLEKRCGCNRNRTRAPARRGARYIICPSTWGAVVDRNTYLFRGDFMEATLDTTTNWRHAQSSAGNVEINRCLRGGRRSAKGYGGTTVHTRKPL